MKRAGSSQQPRPRIEEGVNLAEQIVRDKSCSRIAVNMIRRAMLSVRSLRKVRRVMDTSIEMIVIY